MARKQWTAKTEVTEDLLKFREKRKWQLSYRRYVLERMPCEGYALYFGLDIETLRSWFECQFTTGQGWDGFGKSWQFYHIVPTHHFDFSNENELFLCWSFINIGIESLDPNLGDSKIDPISVKLYFKGLLNRTGFEMCSKMLDKISEIETTQRPHPGVDSFLLNDSELIQNTSSLSKEEMYQLNQGTPLKDILMEREILKKFG